MLKYITVAIAAITFLSTNAQAQSPEDNQRKLIQSEVDLFHAPVKSTEDMMNFLNSNRNSKLDVLSQSAKRDFMDSLVYGEKGLASFRYDILENELSPTDIYGVLSLFGLQSQTGKFENAQVKTALDQAIIDTFEPKLVNTTRFSKEPEFGEFNSQKFGGGFLSPNEDFLEGYRCESKGTCETAPNYACTSNC